MKARGKDEETEVLHYLRNQLGYNASLVIMGDPPATRAMPTCGSYIGKWLGWACSTKCIFAAYCPFLPCFTKLSIFSCWPPKMKPTA